MFERFDGDARRSLFYARAAVSDRDGDGLDPEDLLLGIMLSKPSAVLNFATPGLAPESLTNGDTAEAMLARLQNEILPTHVEMPFAKSVRRVLQNAVQEADALGHATVRPEHLILGIMRDEDTSAWKTLHAAGVSLREMRRRLAE